MKIGGSRETISWLRLQRWLYAQSGLWKWRGIYHFVDHSTYFVLKIELLFAMLSNFQTEAILKDSTFWWVACLTHKVLWSACSLIRNWFDWLCIWLGISNIFGGWWSSRVGQNRETHEKHDEECAEEDFSWLRQNLTEIVRETGNLKVRGIVVSIFEMDQNMRVTREMEEVS